MFDDWFLTWFPEGREEYGVCNEPHTHFVYETHPALQICLIKIDGRWKS